MTTGNENVVTRFAPSPTGNLHIGAYRTALFNYLYTKKHDGKIILRIEDTDKERSKPEYTENIHDALAWLGLSFDETHVQSEMVESHKDALQKLIDLGVAYVSKEPPPADASASSGGQAHQNFSEKKPKNLGGQGPRKISENGNLGGQGKRSEVIRFKNPNTTVTFTDLIRGEISFDTTDLGDFVIAKSEEEPLFHLAVVVDDATAGVTHIIRGEDHISNTPRQILIREALGLPEVTYAHIPLILSPDKSKLSKRKGAKAITDYRDEGFLPEALINFMAFLGWNPGTEQEVFTLDELIKNFSLDQVQKGGAVYNEEKLRWFNKEHMKKLSMEAQKVAIEEWFTTAPKKIDLTPELLDTLHTVVMERIDVWSDIHALIEVGEFDFLMSEPTLDKTALVWKKEENPEQTGEYLQHVRDQLEAIPPQSFNQEIIKESIWEYAGEKGRGNVLWPMRYALSGLEKSPDPFMLAELLGKETALQRLDNAIQLF